MLYLDPVSNLISNGKTAVICSNDQPVTAFLDHLNGAAFFDIHIFHGFEYFRYTEHPLDGAGVTDISL